MIVPRRLLIAAACLVATAGLSGCSSRETPPTFTPAASSPADPSPSETASSAPATSPSATVPSAAASPRASRTPASPRPSGGTTPLPSSLRGKDIERIPTTAKVVALTFDAGANADGLSSILSTLDAKHVRATFFLTGRFVEAYAGRSRQIADAGHRVANHTVSHPHLPALSDARIRSEVLDAERAIRAATGSDPKPFFRFPYGDRNAHTIAVVNAAGYACIRWTVDTLGWKGTDPGGQTAQTVTQRVLGAATPGEIVLMHVGSNPDDHTTLDADALPGVIDALRAKGYTFVTLDALR